MTIIFIIITTIQMNSSSEDKKMLIQSMKKLVTYFQIKLSHISNNPQRQKDIFDALSLQDLNKIILNLKDDNQYLRRISALLLCQLFYQNSHTKAAAVKLVNIQPQFGRICLSGIPESIHKYPSTLKKCIELMKQGPLSEEEDDKICWVINLERKSLKLEMLQYKKYSSFTFIDPLKNIFGFTIPNPNHKDIKPPTTARLEISTDKMAKEPNRHSIVQSPLNKSSQVNSQFYKNYMQARNKSKDSKRYSFNSNNMNVSLDLNDSIDKKTSYTRPITSRLNSNPYSSKREDINTSYDGARQNNTIQNISQFARNGYHKTNQSTYQPSIGYSQKFKESQESSFREINRKMDYGVKEGRHTIDSSRDVMTDHERFYKRVKDILRK